MNNTSIAKPTNQQLKWQDLEMGLFCHFGLNTFYDQEWGDGTGSPDLFNPTEVDCSQWAKTAKRAGFKYLILTAKHHDGFCLWPTSTTDYSIKSSPWKEGKGDLVRECAEACKQEGILFGLYLSPWDRHEPCYQNEAAYDDFYERQLTELLTGYGPLVEIWFDGAGSEGREYDWRRIADRIAEHQPDAMIFNMGRPTIRWAGNEDGLAPYPCWNAASEARVSMFTKDMLTWLPDTPKWVPAECDVPIRKLHWFWHPEDESSLLELDDLINIYYKSVGHGANLLLNIAPDQRGLFPEPDVKRVIEFGDEIKRRFSNPNAITSGAGDVLEIAMPSQQAIDHAVLMEDIAQGERILEYTLEAECEGIWIALVKGTAIGHKKIDRFDKIVTNRIRLTITKFNGVPLIRSFAVFNAGD